MAKCPDCKKDFKLNHACPTSGKSYKTEIVESRAGSPKKINASNDLPPPKNMKEGMHSIADELNTIMKADKSDDGYLGEDTGGSKDMEMFVAVTGFGERMIDKYLAIKKADREREEEEQPQGGMFGGGANWNGQQMAAQAGLRGNFVTTDGMISAGGQTSAPPKKNANSPTYGTANKSSLSMGEALENMDLDKVFGFWESHDVEIWWMLYPLAIEAAGENLALIQMAPTDMVLAMIKKENNFFATHLKHPYIESQFIKLIEKLKEHLEREGDVPLIEIEMTEEIIVVDDGNTDQRLPPPPRGWRPGAGRVVRE